MSAILDRTLFIKDRRRYDIIRRRAAAFSANYAGNNIIQDDIFCLMENYARLHDTRLEILRYPLGNDNLSACTFIRNGVVFVAVNTEIPLCRQIFAAAHELYHMYLVLEDCVPGLKMHDSILDTASTDAVYARLEDIEANAFAGAVLAPGRSVTEQMRIFGIQPHAVESGDILTLMEIFALPCKAMVLRLFEEEIIGKEKAERLIQAEAVECPKLTGRAVRWQRKTPESISFGSLTENMERASKLDAVDSERYREDMEYLERIRKG